MDMASRSTDKGTDDKSAADDTPDAGQPVTGATDDLVEAAFRRGQESPVHPVVGSPNTQPGEGHDALPTAVGRQTLHLEVKMVGRFEWAVFDGDDKVAGPFSKETEAYEQKARLEREDTGGAPLVSVF